MEPRVLLVEGSADTAFYAAFCRDAGIRRIAVKAPGAMGAKVDSKSNAIHVLPDLLKLLDDGSVERLGIVVDADYRVEHGLGFTGTLTHIREKLVGHGFHHEKRAGSGGFVFEHPDGLSPVGAWVMPDNHHDGMLEDFVKAAITSGDQSELLQHARHVVHALPTRRFKDIHTSKAEVATWLAWQQSPGKRIESVVGDTLIDLSGKTCAALSDWLRQIFPGR